MIDQGTIDRIMDAAQIVDVVSEFVTLRKRGVNYIGLCPFHNEKTPSFSVSPSKGVCKCFSCGKGGNVVHFIMEHEQMSYYEALKYLAKKYNIEIKERELSKEELAARSQRESLFIVNEFARNYFQEMLYHHAEGQSIGMAYFRQRGFRDDIIKKFQLGYSLSTSDALAKEALRKGFTKEALTKTGLCIERDNGRMFDRFWGRVMFPVHTLSGKIVAFGGRVMKTDSKTAKYVNSPESEIYHKSNELYGIYFAKQAIVKQDRCFLVEGYTDVISMHQSGIENVVASSGTSLTQGQIRLIHRFTNNITVLYDGDMAGIKASIRGIDMLLEEGMNIKVVLLPDGDDPDSFARKHNATDYQAYIHAHEVDFIRFKTNLLMEDAGNDPIKRAGLISDLVRSISVIPEGIVRSVYTRECSQLLQVDENLLIEEVKKVKARQAEKKYQEQERQRATLERQRQQELQAQQQAQQEAQLQAQLAQLQAQQEAAMAQQGGSLQGGSSQQGMTMSQQGASQQGGFSQQGMTQQGTAQQDASSQQGTAQAGNLPPMEGTPYYIGGSPEGFTPTPEGLQSGSPLPPEAYAPVDANWVPPMDPLQGGSVPSDLEAMPPELLGGLPGAEAASAVDWSKSSPYYPIETALMQMLVRYGERAMCQTEEGELIKVASYIDSELKIDDLELHTPQYRQLLEETVARLDDPQFVAERYFCNHPDPKVSLLAADLVSDRYQLSKYHTKYQKIAGDDERLHELLPQLMADFKYLVVKEECQQLLRELQNPDIYKDEARYTAVMKRYKDLSEIQKMIAKRLGDRTLTL